MANEFQYENCKELLIYNAHKDFDMKSTIINSSLKVSLERCLEQKMLDIINCDIYNSQGVLSKLCNSRPLIEYCAEVTVWSIYLRDDIDMFLVVVVQYRVTKIICDIKNTSNEITWFLWRGNFLEEVKIIFMKFSSLVRIRFS